MATLMCDFCPTNAAQSILTNLDTGDVVKVCAVDFPTFVMSMAEAIVAQQQANDEHVPEPEDEPEPTHNDAIEAVGDESPTDDGDDGDDDNAPEIHDDIVTQ